MKSITMNYLRETLDFIHIQSLSVKIGSICCLFYVLHHIHLVRYLLINLSVYENWFTFYSTQKVHSTDKPSNDFV